MPIKFGNIVKLVKVGPGPRQQDLRPRRQIQFPRELYLNQALMGRQVGEDPLRELECVVWR